MTFSVILFVGRIKNASVGEFWSKMHVNGIPDGEGCTSSLERPNGRGFCLT